jgi:hypothetical protein
MAKTRSGKIITFYSYKGGAGRTMLLANVAWILAQSGNRVLAVDWDLEAPGLQHFFRPFLLDTEVASTNGLIDFLWDFATAALSPTDSDQSSDWHVQYANILRHAVSLQWQFPRGGMLDFVPAGRQDSSYSLRVNSFNWQNFYERIGGGAFFEAVKESMRTDYDYVLIDSRTGVSDTAGICTVQFPDSLVVCFTLNRQSIEGAATVVRSVASQRQKRAEAPIHIFPVPMRIEHFEMDMLTGQRAFARRAFHSLGPTGLDDRRYWENVEIPHQPRYSYFEQLAAFVENPADPSSLLAATLRLTSFLTDGEVTEFAFSVSPADRQRILKIYGGERSFNEVE